MIHLFPKTGIQYVALPKCFAPGAQRLLQPCTYLRDKSDSLPRLYPDTSRGGDDNKARNDAFFGVNEEPEQPAVSAPVGAVQVSAVPRDGLDLFAGGWIPFPYGARNPFWSRVLIREETTHFDVYLAIDTHYERGEENTWHLTEDEVGLRLRPDANNPAFWYSDYVDEFVRGLMPRVPARPGESASDQYIRLTAAWRALAEFLAPSLPVLQMLTPQNSAAEPVEVDLIIDLGNCRTCAIVMETDSASPTPHFHPVPFRSRGQPHLADRGTVDSRLVFSRSPRAVRGGVFPAAPVFNELSIARVGQEARNLGATAPDFGGSLHASGMSSPKRYLWDRSLQSFNWCFVDETNREETVPIEGDVLRYIPQEDPFVWPAGGETGLRNPPVTRHCRKSGLVFLMVEVLTQAYAFINSHDHRTNAPITGGAQRRRVLHNVLLTFPTCMPEQERRELQRGVEKAVRLWQRFVHDPRRFVSDGGYVADAFKGSAAMQPEPSVHLECDEGLAIQLCYIYQELMGVWQNMPQAFFDAHARKRDGQQVLRVASIDVGGGTTDLTIADYRLAPEARGYTRLTVAPLFTHGIRIGGDDVQKTLLEKALLPSLIRSTGSRISAWRMPLGTESLPDSAWLRARQELVPELWVPVAREAWARAERGEHVRELLKNMVSSEPKQSLLEMVRGQMGLSDSLMTSEVDVSPEEVEQVLEERLGAVLADCAALIARFDCDLLVLGGRLVGHPWIKRRLSEVAPISPDSIITLHHHPVRPNLFPFADADGRIADAKTCVVVGATVHFHARTVGGAFEINLAPASGGAGPVIGIINPRTGLLEGAPLFAHPPRQVSSEFPFGGDLWIGAKMVLDDHVLCNPQWRIRWRPQVQQSLRQKVRVDEQFRLSLRLNEATGAPELDFATVRGSFRQTGAGGALMTGNAGHLQIGFQTMFDDHYWLDTGVLSIEEQAIA